MSSFAASGNKASKIKPPQKLYLPNLTLSSSTPDISTLKARLTEHFSNSSITITELMIKKSGTESYAATISCSDVGLAFKCLQNTQFNGGILVVKKFKESEKLKEEGERWGASTGFGGGWEGGNENTNENNPKKKKNRRKKKKKAEGGDEEGEIKEGETNTFEEEVKESGEESKVTDKEAYDDSIDGFNSRLNSSMSELMSAYGEQQPIETIANPNSTTTTSSTKKNSSKTSKKSMLSPNALSPITLTLMSFGYLYSSPPTTYTSLSPFDVRNLEPAEDSVIRLSGISLACKRSLLRNSDKDTQTPIWKVIHEIVDKSVKEIKEAIKEGYGFANPLNLQISIGSYYGRHRGPCVAEAVAIGVRKKLREEEDVGVGVGVKVVHRDLDKKHEGKAYGRKGRKGDDDDD
ncbi:hypothetical protein TrLO_g8220 [Triparma laevis f. longispina]|uniref:Uncharacterized protein n=1 Tax=Triparma laevis f. longispina TaxID=1714387 RepID=A0A9W6ZRR2_9STRA|nr:hypothetical protein TrLO_g8220 [Triparma laevis f. longispina]